MGWFLTDGASQGPELGRRAPRGGSVAREGGRRGRRRCEVCGGEGEGGVIDVGGYTGG